MAGISKMTNKDVSESGTFSRPYVFQMILNKFPNNHT